MSCRAGCRVSTSNTGRPTTSSAPQALGARLPLAVPDLNPVLPVHHVEPDRQAVDDQGDEPALLLDFLGAERDLVGQVFRQLDRSEERSQDVGHDRQQRSDCSEPRRRGHLQHAQPLALVQQGKAQGSGSGIGQHGEGAAGTGSPLSGGAVIARRVVAFGSRSHRSTERAPRPARSVLRHRAEGFLGASPVLSSCAIRRRVQSARCRGRDTRAGSFRSRQGHWNSLYREPQMKYRRRLKHQQVPAIALPLRRRVRGASLRPQSNHEDNPVPEQHQIGSGDLDSVGQPAQHEGPPRSALRSIVRSVPDSPPARSPNLRPIAGRSIPAGQGPRASVEARRNGRRPLLPPTSIRRRANCRVV